MLPHTLSLALLSGLLLSVPTRSLAAPKAAYSELEELPQVSWKLATKGFAILFQERKREIESLEPNRFFPSSVVFALRQIDTSGHFLLLKCHSEADSCSAKRDMLEDRMIYSTLLEVLRTPKASKDALYNARTWELTTLGQKYMGILRKRYPDLPRRLGYMVGTAFAQPTGSARDRDAI